MVFFKITQGITNKLPEKYHIPHWLASAEQAGVRGTGAHSKGSDSSTRKTHTRDICSASLSCTITPGLTPNDHGTAAVIPSLSPVLLTVTLSVAISGSFLALLHGRTDLDHAENCELWPAPWNTISTSETSDWSLGLKIGFQSFTSALY